MNAKQRKAFEEMKDGSTKIVKELTAVANAGSLFLPPRPEQSMEAQFVQQTLRILADVAALQQAILLTVESMAEATTAPRRTRAAAKPKED